MTVNNEFPKWGFWVRRDYIHGSINATPTPHLFLSEEKTACGYNPIIPNMQSFFRYQFSSEPKLEGIYDVAFEVKMGRRITLEDFKKCKKCLKHKEKIEK